MQAPLHDKVDERVEEKTAGVCRVMPRRLGANDRQRAPFAVLVFFLMLTGCAHRVGTASMSAGPTDLEEGLIAYEEKEYTKALEHFKNALKHDPQSVEAHFRSGIIFQRQKKTDLAIAAYRDTIRIDPNHYKTHYNLGNLYSYEKANSAQAIYHYRRFLALVPTHPSRHQIQARLAALTDVGGEGMRGKVVTEAFEGADGIHLTNDITVPAPSQPVASTPSPGLLPSPLPPKLPQPALPSPMAPTRPAPPVMGEPVAFSQVVCIRGENAQGSGFVVEPGYVITAQHVISTANSITVHFHDGSSASGTVLSTSPLLDLALVRIPLQEGTKPLSFAAEATSPVGMAVQSVGCPLGFSHSVAQGIISAPERYIEGRPVLQTDAAVNLGNSGGPLLNAHGDVVGVVLGLFPEARGIAFALPGREAKEFVGKIFFQMGTLMAEAKRYSEAIHLLTRSIFFWPQSARVHNNLGEVYRRVKDSARAEQAYTQAMNLDPNYADGHFNLGILYDSLLPNPKQAAYHYRRYLQLVPASPDATQVRQRLAVLEGKAK